VILPPALSIFFLIGEFALRVKSQVKRATATKRQHPFSFIGKIPLGKIGKFFRERWTEKLR